MLCSRSASLMMMTRASLRDRQQQLAVVLDLFLGGRPEGEVRDLREPVDDAGDLGAELASDVLHPHVGILHHIMQERCRDRGGIEQLLREDLRHRDTVRDEILARHPLLAPVRGRAEAERTVEQLEVEPVAVRLQRPPEFRRCFGEVGRTRYGHPAGSGVYGPSM